MTVELCQVGHNESFGEESLLLDEPISYSVVVSQPAILAVIHRSSLHGASQFLPRDACSASGIAIVGRPSVCL